MTGKDMVTEALTLLNYTDHNGEVDATQTSDITRRGLTFVNKILAELSRIELRTVKQLTRLDEDIPLSDQTVCDIMPYGVAMLIATGEGDGDGQQLMAAIYNQKRASVPRPNERVRDVIPRPWA